MKHRVAGRRLKRSSEHRTALLRNLSTALFERERIRTTLMKAKELRPFAEHLITTAKKDSLHARRLVLRDIHDKTVVSKLFETLATRYAQRPGGYTRIIKLGPRRGDRAEMAVVELVDAVVTPKAEAPPAETSAKPKKRAKKAAVEEPATETRKPAKKKTHSAAKPREKAQTRTKAPTRKSAQKKEG